MAVVAKLVHITIALCPCTQALGNAAPRNSMHAMASQVPVTSTCSAGCHLKVQSVHAGRSRDLHMHTMAMCWRCGPAPSCAQLHAALWHCTSHALPGCSAQRPAAPFKQLHGSGQHLETTPAAFHRPVVLCRQQEGSVRKLDMTLADYVSWWQCQAAAQKQDCLYLKDWHFAHEFSSWAAYKLPHYFREDWLNSFCDHKAAAVCGSEGAVPGQQPEPSQIASSDYRFVYLGPKVPTDLPAGQGTLQQQVLHLCCM